MRLSPSPAKTCTFAVLIFPDFPMMAFSSVIEPLRAANALAGRDIYRWIVVGLDGKAVRASNGVGIKPDVAVADAPQVDRIVACTGGNAHDVESSEAMQWMRKSVLCGTHIGAVADATFVLARAGLLDGYACTLHWTSQSAFAEAFPHVDLRRDIYVIDRNRFTSAGGVGCLDMMLALIAKDAGSELSAGVAEWFVHSPLRASVDRQLMPLRLRTGILNQLVLSAVAIMEETVEERLRLPALAKRLGVSADRLERVFKIAVGASPGSYYRKLRLRRAADLLSHSSLSVREVAMCCGFASMSSFGRAFRETYGRSPRAARH